MSRSSLFSRFWKWTIQPRPSWKVDKTEAAVLFCVFGATGSSSMLLVRPALGKLGLEGSWKEGPNSYRAISFFSVTPIYSLILLTLGTLAGRHAYFAAMTFKIWNRFLPKSVSNKLVPKACNTATDAIKKVVK